MTLPTGNVTLKSLFMNSDRPHVVMITNHGFHSWKIVPGLPDTGGQNLFVNQLSRTLADLGCRITIFNRGGFPDPSTGIPRTGIHYKDAHQRLVYLQDSLPAFLQKEKMASQIPELVDSLIQFLSADQIPVNVIFSHYWDGAEITRLALHQMDYSPPHVWIPHSLGEIKKQNVSASRWTSLNIHQRIAVENVLCEEMDAVVSTSSLITTTLQEHYLYRNPILDLPPCIDTDRFHPRQIAGDDEIWSFLSQHCSLSTSEIRSRKIIMEISRTDTTKRKDVLIKAFRNIHREHPDTILLTSINSEHPAGKDLLELIQTVDDPSSILILSNVYSQLPDLYAISYLYCTPSIMEGFGMSAQEAAATGIPIVSSERVPFAVEVLLGENPTSMMYSPEQKPIHAGEGAIIVPADDVAGFSFAMKTLIENQDLQQAMGRAAYARTIPSYAWDFRIHSFLRKLNNLLPEIRICNETGKS